MNAKAILVTALIAMATLAVVYRVASVRKIVIGA